MVPVGMGKQKMIGGAIFRDHLIAQPPDAGAGVHNDQIIACRADFNARGIPAVF